MAVVRVCTSRLMSSSLCRRTLATSSCLLSRTSIAPAVGCTIASQTRWSRPSLPNQAIWDNGKQIVLRRNASTESVENANSHWKTERIATAALLGSVALGIIYPSPIADYSLALLVPLHAHWGMEQIVLDYIHGPFLHKTLSSLIYVFTFATIGGLLYFNYTDVGICKAVAKLFTQIG